MYYTPTQEDFNLVKQHTKDIYIKVNLLNKQFKVLDSFDGNLLSDSLNVDSKSKQRRTYSCELQVTNPSFFVGRDKKIWIDKYIQIYYGIKNIKTNDKF